MKSAPAVLCIALVLLAGCSGGPNPSSPIKLDTETQTPAPPANPWQADPVVVGITDNTSSERAYGPLVQEALGYWMNNSVEQAGHEINYTIDADAKHPDIQIRFVDSITDCGHLSGENTIGCAPLIDPWNRVNEPTVVRIEAGFTDETTIRTLKHEFGHTLGLDHSEGLAFMNASGRAIRLPMTNATDRSHPWRDANLSVHVDYSNVPTDEEAVYRRQVSHALEYYNAGAEGTVPEEISLRVVNRSDADIVISFPDDAPCGGDVDQGSCGGIEGISPDADPALEYYTHYEITVSGIDSEAVGWHVGYWLGRGMGATDTSELAPPFRDADYEERRSKWWE